MAYCTNLCFEIVLEFAIEILLPREAFSKTVKAYI